LRSIAGTACSRKGVTAAALIFAAFDGSAGDHFQSSTAVLMGVVPHLGRSRGIRQHIAEESAERLAHRAG
jgi:hypothetical protein